MWVPYPQPKAKVRLIAQEPKALKRSIHIVVPPHNGPVCPPNESVWEGGQFVVGHLVRALEEDILQRGIQIAFCAWLPRTVVRVVNEANTVTNAQPRPL